MGNRLHLRVKRTRDDIQQCKDCQGNGSMPNAERPPRSMDCATCNGQGFIEHRAPYRLADGTWSDGVNRSVPLVMSGFGSANEDRMTVFWMRHGSKFGVAAGNPETFPEFESFAEAIAYADRMARTNQGENK